MAERTKAAVKSERHGPRSWMVIAACALCFVTLAPSPIRCAPVAAAQRTRVPFTPIDEAGRRPDFAAFRSELLRIVERKDAAALLRIVDPRVRISFGDENGIEAFRKRWQLDRSPQGDDPLEGTNLWEELGAVLRLGGQWQGRDTFAAPYVFTKAFPAGYDYAIVAAGVSVRTAPRVDAAVIERLTFEVVRNDAGAKAVDGQWRAVDLRDGRRGFVHARYARSPMDYRAYFTRSGSAWRMVAFVAGD